MDEKRKFEIGYLLLMQQLQEEGLLLNTRFKRQLNNAARTLGIPDEEIADFAVLITRDVSNTTETAPT